MNDRKSILLPNGDRIYLSKPWQQYTVSELAALGLKPNMSLPGASPIGNISGFIPFD